MTQKKLVQTARQIRRQQQRESISPPLPPTKISAPSEMLGPSVLAPVFASMIVVGSFLYKYPGFARLKGNELSAHQSLFTAVNAATLTGFQQASNPDDYTPAGRTLTLLLMIAGMLFTFIGSGLAVTRIARLRFLDKQVITWSIGSILAVGLLGGLALCGDGRNFFDGIFQAISAFGNCGLTLGPLPEFAGVRTFLVLLPLIVLGGLGLPVLMDICDRRTLSAHSRTVLSWTAGVYLLVTLGLFGLRLTGASMHWKDALVEASQQSINARSAGFPFQFAEKLPQATTFMLLIVMVIGAAPGGTAGGIKVTTVALLAKGTRDVLASRPTDRRFGVAIQWLLIYLLMLTISTLALLITEPQIHLDRTLFLATSALGNVGLSHNPIDVSTAGLYVLSATMMLGRVAPMMMLWHVIDTTPEATIAIG